MPTARNALPKAGMLGIAPRYRPITNGAPMSRISVTMQAILP